MSKTDKVKAKLAKKSNPSSQEIKGWSAEIGCSPSLVYKWLKRMPQAERMAETPAEPVVRIEEGSEEVIEPPAEETAEAEFEVPAEFEGKEEAEAVEVAEEEAPAEISLEEEEEEQRILKAISKRAVGRLFNIAIDEGLGLAGAGLTSQEAEDTEFLILLMVSKYLLIEVRENMLEVTGALHFGSIGAKVLVAWLKKRAEEKKKEEEKPVKLGPTEKPEPTEEEPIEVPMSTVEETHEDAEEIRENKTKTHEKAFLKRVTGGNV